MHYFFKIVFIFVLLTIKVNAQTKNYLDFIPEGYTLFEKYFGDLNKDGVKDCVLIIKNTDKSKIVVNRFDKKVDRNRRGILILFKTKKGYKLADKNYSCFSSENEDGGVYFPPELWINFKRGNLIVHYGHGRYGYWNYTFRYQDNSFKLIGYDSSSNRGPHVEYVTSINFLTKRKLSRENISEEVGEEEFKDTWSNIKLQSLIQLSSIKDFDELELTM